MTKLRYIYDIFSRKVTDLVMFRVDASDEEILDDLYGYLMSAKSKFTECRQPLDIETDIHGDMYFVSKLTDFEIEILVSLMIVEYLKPKMISDDTLRPALSDKDFKIYSQANQLREISLLYRNLYSESRKMITKYSFMKLGAKDGNI